MKFSIAVQLVDIYSYTIGYEPAGLTVHPPPPKRSRVASFFSHWCLVPPKFFPKKVYFVGDIKS